MASPGSPMMSQADRQMMDQQMVYQQLQQQAQQQIQVQNQFNGAGYVNGFGAQQQAFGGGVAQPAMAFEVAPATFQGTVPSPPQGALYSQPNFAPQANGSMNAVQQQELRNYLVTPPRR